MTLLDLFWTVLAAGVAAFGGSYLRERGKNLATHEDLVHLTAQVASTTRAAEEIKTSIAHMDWLEREWRTIRRSKLEELMSSVHQLQAELDMLVSNSSTLGVEANETPAAARLTLLSSLYFPELDASSAVLVAAASVIRLEVLKYRDSLSRNPSQHAALVQKWSTTWPPLYKNIVDQVKAFERQMPALSQSIARRSKAPM